MPKIQSRDKNIYPLLPDHVLHRAKHFGFEQYVKTLARLISGRATKTPITISIHGQWGSGKSSLMKTVQKIIGDKETYKEYFGEDKFQKTKSKVIWFNAWEYECKEDIGLTILQYIGLELKKDEKAKTKFPKVKNYLKIVGKIAADTILRKAGNISLDEVEEYISKYQEEAVGQIPNLSNLFKEAVNEYIEKSNNERIIIFIDDLDRCSIKNAKNIIDAIRLFLTTEKCVFILGLDIDRLQKSLDHEFQHLKDFDAREYIDKIVQLRFELPPLYHEDVKKYARELFPSNFEEKYIETITMGIQANPRNIKLFANNLRFQLTLSRYQTFEVKEFLLVMWLVLKHSFPLFAAEIERDPNSYELLKKYMENADSYYENLTEEEKEEYFVKEGLKVKYLANKRLKRILTTTETDFTKEDLNNIIHQTAASSTGKKSLIRKYRFDTQEISLLQNNILKSIKSLDDIGSELNRYKNSRKLGQDLSKYANTLLQAAWELLKNIRADGSVDSSPLDYFIEDFKFSLRKFRYIFEELSEKCLNENQVKLHSELQMLIKKLELDFVRLMKN